MRTIRKIHSAAYRPISDLVTYSPMPSSSLRMIDPFLFLNHHGLQKYPPNNSGLPFGPHPHRGMETVTFILDGDVAHKDTSGHQSVINKGGVQWMTAGKGLMHEEVSSEKFKREGGALEVLQLWVNLPARLKMTEPRYKGFQREAIPTLQSDDAKVQAQVICGNLNGTHGAFDTLTPINLSTLYFKALGSFEPQVPKDHNILCYVVGGEVKISGRPVGVRNLVEFTNEGQDIKMEALTESIVLLGHAKPFNEPVVSGGPFVMNSMEEINQAYEDFQKGNFGNL